MASVDYLVGHVAVGDGRTTDPGASALTRYYTAAGYPPGTWLGAGLTAMGASEMVGSEVTEDQLRALFEQSRSPFGGEQLGRPPARYPTRQERIDRRVGKIPETLTPDARAALIEKITAEEKETKTRTAVAGFDLTFSVPKSVSALWALAPAPVQEQMYLAHRAALAATFERIEAEAAFTRMGTHGVRRVRATGLVAAAFDHWDSRKGDPQLHTHVTVANRVPGPDGRWRTLDSATLHKAAVAYSETYNLLLADEITRRTGLTWDHRERQAGSNRRAARELTPVPDALIAVYSQRSADIEAAVDAAITKMVLRSGRRPDSNAINRIRQHLTLTTRGAKKAPNLAESVQQWTRTASQVLDQDDPAAWAAAVIGTAATTIPRLTRAGGMLDETVTAIAVDVVDAVAMTRATWTRWNLTAEAMRRLALHGHQYESVDDALAVRDRIVAAAEQLSISLTPPEVAPVPDGLLEADGASPFSPPETFTSTAVLRAEDDLLRLADDHSGPAVNPDRADRIAGEPLSGRGYPLALEDQAPAATRIVTSGRMVDVLVGPAGTGKTTTMAGVRALWEAEHGPGTVLGLAPSAVAAQVLADELNVVTDNTAQWIAQQEQQDRRAQRIDDLEKSIDRADDQVRAEDLRRALVQARADFDRWRLRPGQLLVVDEAGMCDTFTLAQLARQAGDAGAKLLLVGDPCQLSAVQTGGAFGLLCGSRPDAPTLTQVRRFVEPDGTRRTWEEQAADRLRSGDSTALQVYAEHGRVRSGEQDLMTGDAYTAWLTDTRNGLTSVLIAADNDTVVELNQRARADLIGAGQVDDTATAPVRGGLSAGRGDVVVTRRIDRTQTDGTPRTTTWHRDGFVRNGQRWTVERAHRDGSLTIRLHAQDHAAPITLSAAYVHDHVDLGYATTAHRAQGLTVDTSHVLADALTQREAFYVAMTRGRFANTAYLVLDPAATVRVIVDHPVGGPADQDSWTTAQVAESITDHSSASASAHETIRAVQDQVVSIRKLADEADAIAAYAHDIAAAELLLTIFGDRPAIHALLDDHDFPELVLAIRHAHSAGMNVATELPRIVSNRRIEMVTAASLATTIRAFLRTRPTNGRPELVAGIVVNATLGLSDPLMLDALRKRYESIERRADSLADVAVESEQPWVMMVARSQNGDDSRSLLRVVAAFRERWDISGDAPLGPRPDHSADRAHHGDYKRLTEILQHAAARLAVAASSDFAQPITRRGRDL